MIDADLAEAAEDLDQSAKLAFDDGQTFSDLGIPNVRIFQKELDVAEGRRDGVVRIMADASDNVYELLNPISRHGRGLDVDGVRGGRGTGRGLKIEPRAAPRQACRAKA